MALYQVLICIILRFPLFFSSKGQGISSKDRLQSCRILMIKRNYKIVEWNKYQSNALFWVTGRRWGISQQCDRFWRKEILFNLVDCSNYCSILMYVTGRFYPMVMTITICGEPICDSVGGFWTICGELYYLFPDFWKEFWEVLWTSPA